MNTDSTTDGDMAKDSAVARRFLHVCYVCRSADDATSFFVGELGMRNTMRTTNDYAPGDIFGMDRRIKSVASFVYDPRGPRISPAIEIQEWSDPDTWGSPSIDPTSAGIKAVGFSTPTFDAVVDGLLKRGCTPVKAPVGELGTRAISLVDPTSITIDVHEAPNDTTGTARLSHLRATVTDLEASVIFYEELGFAVVETEPLSGSETLSGSELSFATDQNASVSMVTLQLPDEPFRLQLVQWHSPDSHGRHYDRPNHAGLYRAALCVDDTRAAYASMTASGSVFDRPPLQVELSGTPVPDMWITFISDPDGIPWEFVQRPRSAFRSSPLPA